MAYDQGATVHREHVTRLNLQVGQFDVALQTVFERRHGAVSQTVLQRPRKHQEADSRRDENDDEYGRNPAYPTRQPRHDGRQAHGSKPS